MKHQRTTEIKGTKTVLVKAGHGKMTFRHYYHA
jgi:hypothetical protein